MGAMNGSNSFSTFQVRGDAPEDFRDVFLEGARKHALVPLTADDEVEKKAGWCSIERHLDTDLTHEKIFYGSYLNLGLRIDAWKIPATLLKAHVEEATIAYLEKTAQKKLARSQKKEIRATVLAELKRKHLPTIKVIDLSWNLDTGQVRFWNQSAAMHERLEALFEMSFGLRLLPQCPYAAAIHTQMPDGAVEELTALSPSVFHKKPEHVVPAPAIP